jgi:hypothetical protein
MLVLGFGLPLRSSPKPASDDLRLDENQCPLSSWRKPQQDYPEQFVMSNKLQLRMLLYHNGELLRRDRFSNK